MPEIAPLPASALKLVINPDTLNISTTDSNVVILGQTRAKSALTFGVDMASPGYNIFVMGEPGSGRLTLIMDHLGQFAERQEAPSAYAYVENFDNAREPVVIELPAGQGQRFAKDIEKLIDSLLATFPAAFESPTYQQKKTAIERRFNQRYSAAIDLVDKKARSLQVALFRETDTITFLPVRNNKTLDEEQFTLLPQAERDAFQKNTTELEEYLGEVLLELPQWRRNMAEEIKQLDQETIERAIAPLFAELNTKYQNIDDVITYLAELKKDLSGATIGDVLMPSRSQDSADNTAKRLILTEQYVPNILVDHKGDSGAPIIYESHPTYQNLFGRIEYINDQGTLVTNYRRICPGALHRANGGCLILDADKVLTYPFVWEGLKRALKSGRIEIESPYTEWGINTITLKPEVIPLDVKVILIGPREIYYLLEELDGEFNEMFRVLADFDDQILLNESNIDQFAHLMMRHALDTGAGALGRDAVVRLIEHSCRVAENQRYFSAHINDCLKVIGEANLLSRQKEINAHHIDQALAAREARNGRIADEILTETLEGTILIDTEGVAVGQINGLTVLEVGGSSFGAPARITSTIYPGARGIVDIEREAELGQAIHSKGVLILTGFLGHRYAQQFPLSISANIAMEQSYGYVDGDSASLAELCCLISALTRIPVKQSIAVTGSINQYGQVQAIGGVNDKIEGFFSLCQARGLTGTQGVVIPRSNQRNLMLKQAVIEAVAEGRFAIYAVAHVDEALSLLMGRPAGDASSLGEFPQNTINHTIVARLKEISDLSHDYETEKSGEEH